MKEMSESEFDFLMNNSSLIDIQVHLIKRFSKRKEEIFAFFDKIPLDKMMQVKFPDEDTWETYNTRLRTYAIKYTHHLSISKRKNENGYFIYIIKKQIKEEKDGKDLEIKSI